MAPTLKIACIQNLATPDVGRDLETLARLIESAAGLGATLIATPEYCAGLETRDGRLYPFAAAEAEHPVIPAMSDLARRHRIWILVGSIGVRAADGRISNRSLLFASDGRIVARYDKLHLFDVDLGAGRIYRESATIAPGNDAVLAPGPAGPIGLSICYDLRFAALYRAYAKAGAVLLAVPAAFTRTTGEAHWHVLNRARAIETGSYVISPCQYGTLAGGAQCYGHSLIVDPWGQVLADGGDSEGVILADIDIGEVAKARHRIPALTHDRPIALHHPAAAAE
jgi:predicted amidohydrolase